MPYEFQIIVDDKADKSKIWLVSGFFPVFFFYGADPALPLVVRVRFSSFLHSSPRVSLLMEINLYKSIIRITMPF